MSTLFKEYGQLENGKEIKFSISFNKSSVSWATSQPTPIGYRVSVTPVERSSDGMMEITSAFSGFNDTVVLCKRQGKTQLQLAIEALKEKKEMYMEQFKPGGKYEIK